MIFGFSKSEIMNPKSRRTRAEDIVRAAWRHAEGSRNAVPPIVSINLLLTYYVAKLDLDQFLILNFIFRN